MLRIGSFLRLLVYIFEIIGIGSFFLLSNWKERVLYMETKQIMLVCAAGMSTSLMVSKMEKAAQDQGLDAHIFAVPVPEAKEYLQNNAVDVLLLGPQVRYLKNEFSADLSARGIPVEVIPMTDYGMMKGDKVLDLAVSLMG